MAVAARARRTRGRRVATLVAVTAALAWSAPARADWHGFGFAEGLRGSATTALLEDRRQVLWLGTNFGISRFDGARVRSVAFADLPPGRHVDYVSAIAEDDSGFVWLATNDGLLRGTPDGASFAVHTSGDAGGGPAGDDVRAAVADGHGHLWFGTRAGLSRLDLATGTWTTFTRAGTNGGLVADEVTALAIAPDGSTWIGTTGGLSHYRPGTGAFESWTNAGTAGALPSDRIASISIAPSGDAWLATDGGVARYSPGTNAWRAFAYDGTNAGPGSLVPNVVLAAADGVWVGGESGVSRFDPASFTWENEDAAATDGVLTGSTSYCISRGTTGRTWFGGIGPGASLFDGSRWETVSTATTTTGPPAGLVQCLATDAIGSLWAGTLAGTARFDGTTWRTFTRSSTSNGLAGDIVQAILPISGGRVAFGTSAGASLFGEADSTWIAFTAAGTGGGLPADGVRGIVRDSTGHLWFCTAAGLGRYDLGANSWRSFTPANTAGGLVDSRVNAGVCDRTGKLWFCTATALCEFDPGLDRWTAHTLANSGGTIEGVSFFAAIEGRDGTLWFATDAGITRRDPLTGAWKSDSPVSTGGGLAAVGSRTLTLDDAGHVWTGTNEGASVYDGERWIAFVPSARLGSAVCRAIAAGADGRLWFGSASGLVRYTPDHVAPVVVAATDIPAILGSRDLTLSFATGFAEPAGVEYSHRADSGPWTAWDGTASWLESSLSDGPHRFEFRARDLSGNVSDPVAAVDVVIDATAPVAILSSPAFGSAVRDTTPVLGDAEDARFLSYRLRYRSVEDTVWKDLGSDPSRTPVHAGTLGYWITNTIPDGDYELRLEVRDALGLMGAASVVVEVDNTSPGAEQTSPVQLIAGRGGDVYSSDGDARLYLPPNALPSDGVVYVRGMSASPADTLANGSAAASRVWTLDWPGGALAREGVFDVRFATPWPASRPVPTIAHRDPLEGWIPVGGALSGDRTRLSAPVSRPGSYAMFEASTPVPPRPIERLDLALTPRAFSPRSGRVHGETAVDFSLPAGAGVTVTVHNRAGRLVRSLASGLVLPAGRHSLHWDGRDDDGRQVPPDLYIVSVHAAFATGRSAVVVLP